MATRLLVDVILTLSDLNIAPADMDAPFAMPGPGDLRRHEGRDTTIEDLPDEILATSLLGMEPPFSHRRICKQLRSLFDESCTQLRIQDHRHLAKEGVMQHSNLLSLLRRLPRLDTLWDMDRSRSEALPWDEMGQTLGGQLTHLIFHCNTHLGFLELFPSLRRLEMIRSDLMPSHCTLELQPLSALIALQELGLRVPVKDLGPLSGCSQLQLLDMAGCYIEDPRLGPLAHCKKLRTLRLCGVDTLRDLGPLGECDSLQHLDISRCSSITNLKPLELCTNLLYLNLSFSRASDFEALSACTALRRLDLSSCWHLRSLAPLASCCQLRHLDIGSNKISSLEPLWGLQELQHIELWDTHTSWLNSEPPELGPLTRVKRLQLDFPSGGRGFNCQ